MACAASINFNFSSSLSTICKNKKNEIKIKFEITFIEISNFTIRK